MNANETGTETKGVTMAYDHLRVTPQRLANRGVHQAPRGDLIDVAHPAEAGAAAPDATPTAGRYVIRRECRTSLSRTAVAAMPPMSVSAMLTLAPGCSPWRFRQAVAAGPAQGHSEVAQSSCKSTQRNRC